MTSTCLCEYCHCFTFQRCDQIQTINVTINVCLVRIRTVREVFCRGAVFTNIILVICKFIDFMSLCRNSVWFSFSVKQFPSAEFGICNV